MTRKLFKQGYFAPRLGSSLQKFYGCHHNLDDRYEISRSQMTMDFLFTFYVDVLFPLPLPRLLSDYILRVALWVSYKKQKLLTIREHPSSPRFIGMVRIAYLF